MREHKAVCGGLLGRRGQVGTAVEERGVEEMWEDGWEGSWMCTHIIFIYFQYETSALQP